jgi:hypothetical protein
MSTDSVRKILETAKATYEQLAAAAPDEPELQHGRASMLNEFGQTYQTLGELEQALKVYGEGLAIADRLVASDAANLKWRRRAAQAVASNWFVPRGLRWTARSARQVIISCETFVSKAKKRLIVYFMAS